MFQEQVNDLNGRLKSYNQRNGILRDLDLFVLDNSLRETTVGQLRAHTMENKWKIFNEVKRVGFKHIVVESFNHRTRLGDTFIRELIAKGEDMSNYFAFSEFIEKIGEDKLPLDEVPIGLEKMKTLGISNVILEMDLDYYGIDYNKFNAEKMSSLLLQRFNWIRQNLSPDSLIFVNLRDFSPCMKDKPERVFYIVNFLASLPEKERIFGIAYEEGGTHMPEHLAVWTSCVRREMIRCGWNTGHLIIHVHEQWGMCDVVQLECLSNGATGIWAGLCEEGAAMGHASSALTIMNLIRKGNRKVLKKFNCCQLRNASIAVTEITTGNLPHPKQPLCGVRALDTVFGFQEIAPAEFNLAAFFGQKAEIRISNMATPGMIVRKLYQVFGVNPQFTEEIANNMIDKMLKDLHENRKEEYNSTVGLAVLFDRSGGQCTEAMSNVIANSQDAKTCAHMNKLMQEIRERWDHWDISDGVKDDQVEFAAFYNGFMAPYFGSYRSEETRKALQAIDMDNDGNVDWNEFALYLKWAAYQYPNTTTADELIDIAFTKGILPAMQDEILKDHQRKTEDQFFSAKL